MQVLIWIGAVITLLGFAGIVYSLVAVLRARRKGDEEALRKTLARVGPVNIGALLASVFGLICVITGIALG
jgi:hypothetical protein